MRLQVCQQEGVGRAGEKFETTDDTFPFQQADFNRICPIASGRQLSRSYA
jgi:hypothetical protein